MIQLIVIFTLIIIKFNEYYISFIFQKQYSHTYILIHSNILSIKVILIIEKHLFQILFPL